MNTNKAVVEALIAIYDNVVDILDEIDKLDSKEKIETFNIVENLLQDISSARTKLLDDYIKLLVSNSSELLSYENNVVIPKVIEIENLIEDTISKVM